MRVICLLMGSRESLPLMIYKNIIFLCSIFIILSFAENVKSDEVPDDYFKISGFSSKKELEEFFNEVKLDIAGNDSISLGKKILFPIGVFGEGGELIKINDRSEFIQKYQEIFTDRVKVVISKQSFSDITGDSTGVDIARGLLWVSNVEINNNFEIKITAINKKALRFFREKTK